MQDLYRNMYLKYAPNLSEEELNQKVSYAMTQDKDTFVNAFYDKYTGSGPSKVQSQYIKQQTENPDDRSFVDKLGDAFVIGIDDKVAGLINVMEEIHGGYQDVADQVRMWNDTGEWRSLSGEEKVANRSKVKEEGLRIFGKNIWSAEELQQKVDTMRARQGVYNQTITEDIGDGNIGQALERVVLGGAESWTSYLSLFSPKALGVLGVSTAGNKWDEEMEKDPDRANALLLLNAAGTGFIEFGEGMISRRLLGIGGGTPTKAAKQLTMTAAQRYVNNITRGFAWEGGTEMAQALGTTLWDKATLGYDTRLDTKQKWYEILDEGIIGAFMGGNVGGIQTLTTGNRALEGRAEVLLRPEEDNKYIKTKYNELTKLTNELSNEKDEDVRTELNGKINKLADDIVIKQSQTQKVVRSMRGQDLMNYATNVNVINKANKKLKKDNIAPETRKMYESQVEQATEANQVIWKDHVHKSLNNNLSVTEAYANKAGVRQQVIDNATEFQKAYENSSVGKKQALSNNGVFDDVKLADGFFDGQGNWYINKEQALKTEAVSVGSHELLHGLVKSTIQGVDGNLSTEGERLVKEFINTLSPRQARVIQKRIDANYRYQRDTDGNLLRDEQGKLVENEFKQYGEEYLNAYSDAIIKREINLDESVADKLANFFQGKWRQKGINKNFRDGLDVYDFLKGYNKSIQTGKVDEGLVEMLRESAKAPAGGVMFSNNVGRRPEEIYTGDLLTDIDALVTGFETQESFKNNYPVELTYLFDPNPVNTGNEEYDNAMNALKRNFDLLILKGIQGKGLYGKDKDTFARDVKERLMIKSYQEFDPQKNESFYGWMHGKKSILNFVKGDVSNDYKAAYMKSIDKQREGKEGSVLETQIADTALNPEELMIVQQNEEARAEETKADNVRKKLGVKKDGDLYNDVLDANDLAMSMDVTVENLPGILKDTFISKLTDKFSGLMGIGKKYIEVDNEGRLVGGFLYDNGTWLIKKIPVRDLVQMEREVPAEERIFTRPVKTNMIPSEIRAHEKEYGHTDNLYYESETQGPTLYERLEPTPDQMLKFFNPPAKIISKKTGKEVRSGLKGNRKTTLAKHGAVQLGLDGTMQALDAQPEEAKRPSLRLESNKKLLQKEKAELALQISRDPNVKLSMSTYSGLTEAAMAMENPYDMFDKGFKKIKKSILKEINVHAETANKWFEEFSESLENEGPVSYLGAQALSYIQRKMANSGKKLTASLFETTSEQLYIDQVKSHKVKGIEMLHDKPTNEGGHPDLKIGIRKSEFNIELKKGPYDAQGPSINGNIDWLTGDIEMKAHPDFVQDENVVELVKEAQKNITKARNKIIRLMKAEFPHLPRPGDKNFKNQIPASIYNRVFKVSEGGQGTTLSQKEGDASFYKLVYNSKKQAVKLIEYIGHGLFGMNAQSIGKQAVPELEADILYKMRISGNTVKDGKGNPIMVKDVNGEPTKQKSVGFRILGSITDLKSKSTVSLLDKKSVAKFSRSVNDYSGALENNNKLLFSKSLTLEESIRKLRYMDRALQMTRRKDAPAKGLSIIDFDDTLAITNSQIYVMTEEQMAERDVLIEYDRFRFGPYYQAEFAKMAKDWMKITPAEFAERSEELEAQGYTFDFIEFNKVIDGKPGPFLEKARKLKEKFGTSDIFVLTARPQASAPAIQKFLKEMDINIPLQNIKGLEDGRPEAKADFIVMKAAQGYNDFLFADDAIKNVEAVKTALDILDVKGKVYQARPKFSYSQRFNEILFENEGVDANQTISQAAAKTSGAINSKWEFYIPPSAEDFVGLMYKFIGKGKKGESQMKFLKETLIDPFARSYRMLNHAKQRIADDFSALKTQHEPVWSRINEDIGYKNFTVNDAVRVYLWTKNGYKIPGASEQDVQAMVNFVRKYGDVMSFANELEKITRLDAYPKPLEFWTSGNITRDLYDVVQRVNRKEYLQEWIENKNDIFNPDNMNKIEALYGTHFREALEDMLWRMENGTNRKTGKNRQVNQWLDWVNNSVGAIMFFNIRSAMLQTISFANFINWTYNNPMMAAKAFSNQEQFWSDFSMIFNSDTLKQRRAGLQTDVNAAEMANAVRSGQGQVNAAISYLLKIGFTPTQMADSFAISFGGASMYRNNYNRLKKQGLTDKQAHDTAMNDFLEASEKAQQSARPDMISQQQAGPLGRLILAFQNTPMQYMRLTKKAVLDLKNGRGDVKTNISKILYYTTVQNILFNGLQSALFMMMGFSDDEEAIEDKKVYALNNALDTILRGGGIAGASVATIKNMLLRFKKEDEKGYRADHARTLIEAINISPPIGSKARKLYNSFISYKYNKDEIQNLGFHPDNPGILGVANFVSATTNIPLDRAVMIVNNIRASSDSNNEVWQRISTLLGWNWWDVGIERPKYNFRTSKTKKKTRKKKSRQ